MEKNIVEIFFDTKPKLYDGLCCRIQQTLTTWLREKEYCGLVLPGGQTPRPLYAKLAASDLDWSKIYISLSDERCVAADNELSNEAFLRKELLDKIGPEVLFQSLVVSDNNESKDFDALLKYMNQWTSFNTFSVLGMGDDGHIASLFPDCEASMESINQTFNKHFPEAHNSGENYLISKTGKSENKSSPPLVLTRAPKEPKQRISASFNTLRSHTKTVLLITGDEKMQLYLECKNATPNSSAYSLPVAHLLRSSVGLESQTLDLYWAP
ncbi:MAG: hypothetical protein COB51_03255 [Moraxellaceae bacterium]|nr:MAG: hypothetical protein COB51_03255 [Moraxellaceae bacterium]